MVRQSQHLRSAGAKQMYSYEEKRRAVQNLKTRIYREQTANGVHPKQAERNASRIAERAAEKHDRKQRS